MNKNNETKTYLEYYTIEIMPKLKAIDVCFKASAGKVPYVSIKEAAKMLQIEEAEIEHMMNNFNITFLDKQSFFQIMANGTSEVCKLFNREIKCSSHTRYHPEDVAYIYNLRLENVLNAFKKHNIKEAAPNDLKKVFAEIKV